MLISIIMSGNQFNQKLKIMVECYDRLRVNVKKKEDAKMDGNTLVCHCESNCRELKIITKYKI